MPEAKDGVKDGGAPAADADVKKEGAPSDTEKDEKGVPWENRAKEAQRKYDEAMSRLNDLESRMNQSKAGETSPEETAKQREARLQEFVSDPDSYIERKITERRLQEEYPRALAWIKEQKGFNADQDMVQITRIIKDYGLETNPSFMSRARAAWDILKAQKLEKEFTDLTSDRTREQALGKGRPEGAGKAVPPQTAPKRSEVLAKLHEAQKRGDYMKSAEYISMLEDVRE